MTAATKDRNTLQRQGDVFIYPVGRSSLIHAGVMVMNDGGYFIPAAADNTKPIAGVSREQVDNSQGSDGDLNVTVGLGVFQFANSAAVDEVTLADVGNPCYVADDQTVAKTDATGSRQVAGTVRHVDTAGVWVEI